MAASMKYLVVLCLLTAASWIQQVDSSSSVSISMCRPQSNSVIHDLQLQCPHPISSSSPIEMDGESLDGALSSSQTNAYIAVLFYASSCPFSSGIRTKFVALSTIFPQIRHVMVEQSSAMPSVLSRYGIHSMPSILVVNQTVRARYHGRKDLSSFVQFYKRTTGLDLVVDLTEDQGSYSESGHNFLHPWKGNSVKEMFMREPYLVFSTLFLFLRVFLYFFPGIISRLIALWVGCVSHLNVGIFGEWRQLLGRILHVIDLKRAWSKLKKLCKTRSLHNGARSARVWASSLASFSLGERAFTKMNEQGQT